MRLTHLALTLSALSLAPGAFAQEAPELPPASPASPPRPRLVHAPRGVAPASEPTLLRFDLLHAPRVARFNVSWRAAGTTAWQTLACVRDDGAWRAEIPAQAEGVRAVEYYVTLATPEGESIASFASAESPHTVILRASEDDEQEQRDLRAQLGRRLEFLVGAEYTDFGTRPNPDGRVCGNSAGAACRDWWYLLYGQVRYRFHRRVRSVLVRVERLSGVTTRAEPIGNNSREVGLVSATTEVELRLLPWFTLSVLGILGANETAVQVGGGARIELGTSTLARVQLSVQGVTNYGYLASAWMRWDTVPNTPLGAGVEVTTQPGANSDVGVRLLFEAGRHFGQHFSLTLRGGYGARRGDAAGFTGGANATVAF